MDEAVERRKAQGCHLFIVSSGDPLAKEQEAIALCNKHSDCVFAAFTPPQSITEQLCVDLLRVCNLFPAIRVDVDPQDARRAAELLRRYRLPFGVACGCTAEPLRGRGAGGRLAVRFANALAGQGLEVCLLCRGERTGFYTRLGFAPAGALARYTNETGKESYA